MIVTLDLMAAFVRCRYKAFLKCTGEVGVATEYALLERELADEYQERAIAGFATRFTPDEIVIRPPSLQHALQSRSRLIVNASCNPERGSITFPAVERTASRTSTGKQEHALIMFSPNNKLAKNEKLTAAMPGSALSSWHGLTVTSVKMIHGPQYSTTKLVLLGSNGITRLAKEATAMFHDLEALAALPTRPTMYLNEHCGICDFRDRCRKDAIDRDDLSLLRGLQPKEIEAWKKRGIFTVTQLAYTFRAKTMGRSSQQPKRHSQPLQAMAVRDSKTYIRRRPDMPIHPARIFFDVEGIPERDSFYLIGVVVATDGSVVSHKFWADDDSQEEGMWRNFMDLVTRLGDSTLIHYGRYERDFFREMQRRYPIGDEKEAERLFSRLFDVHGAVRTNVFFPVFSNSLKEIATFLRFRWQGPVRSGIDSIVHRYRWEETEDESLKEDLCRYNQEDCLAVMALCDHLAALSQDISGAAAVSEMTDGLPDARGRNFSRKEFAIPAMKSIVNCAYFNYQRDKVFFRTDRNVKRSARRKQRISQARPRVNQIIVGLPPEKCPRCQLPQMVAFGASRATKIVNDAKFFRGGVKRWVVKYETRRYECRACRHTCYSPEYPTKQPLFGRGVASWAVYQHVALQQSFVAASESINDVFGYSFSDNISQRAHCQLALVYAATENLLLTRLRAGNVICGDETKIGIRRGVVGYVWVFSGPEVVLYRFSESRDATVLNEVITGFSGIVVSDFYGVYDSVPCAQQKCLIHLLRDINDDLLKSPFDDELKELASRFTELMTPIIGAIDRYGLTKRHLARFVTEADRYRHWLADVCFTSKAAQHYQTRIGKYGDRLFTFLSHDGVPWNNNLAENAVKMIVSRRKMLDGLMSKDGIRNYLIFLSIYQTLRRKGGSFLRFLLSGKMDLFEFLGE